MNINPSITFPKRKNVRTKITARTQTKVKLAPRKKYQDDYEDVEGDEDELENILDEALGSDDEGLRGSSRDDGEEGLRGSGRDDELRDEGEEEEDAMNAATTRLVTDVDDESDEVDLSKGLMVVNGFGEDNLVFAAGIDVTNILRKIESVSLARPVIHPIYGTVWQVNAATIEIGIPIVSFDEFKSIYRAINPSQRDQIENFVQAVYNASTSTYQTYSIEDGVERGMTDSLQAKLIYGTGDYGEIARLLNLPLTEQKIVMEPYRVNLRDAQYEYEGTIYYRTLKARGKGYNEPDEDGPKTVSIDLPIDFTLLQNDSGRVFTRIHELYIFKLQKLIAFRDEKIGKIRNTMKEGAARDNAENVVNTSYGKQMTRVVDKMNKLVNEKEKKNFKPLPVNADNVTAESIYHKREIPSALRNMIISLYEAVLAGPSRKTGTIESAAVVQQPKPWAQYRDENFTSWIIKRHMPQFIAEVDLCQVSFLAQELSTQALNEDRLLDDLLNPIPVFTTKTTVADLHSFMSTIDMNTPFQAYAYSRIVKAKFDGRAGAKGESLAYLIADIVQSYQAMNTPHYDPSMSIFPTIENYYRENLSNLDLPSQDLYYYIVDGIHSDPLARMSIFDQIIVREQSYLSELPEGIGNAVVSVAKLVYEKAIEHYLETKNKAFIHGNLIDDKGRMVSGSSQRTEGLYHFIVSFFGATKEYLEFVGRLKEAPIYTQEILMKVASDQVDHYQNNDLYRIRNIIWADSNISARQNKIDEETTKAKNYWQLYRKTLLASLNKFGHMFTRDFNDITLAIIDGYSKQNPEIVEILSKKYEPKTFLSMLAKYVEALQIRDAAILEFNPYYSMVFNDAVKYHIASYKPTQEDLDTFAMEFEPQLIQMYKEYKLSYDQLLTKTKKSPVFESVVTDQFINDVKTLGKLLKNQAKNDELEAAAVHLSIIAENMAEIASGLKTLTSKMIAKKMSKYYKKLYAVRLDLQDSDLKTILEYAEEAKNLNYSIKSALGKGSIVDFEEKMYAQYGSTVYTYLSSVLTPYLFLKSDLSSFSTLSRSLKMNSISLEDLSAASLATYMPEVMNAIMAKYDEYNTLFGEEREFSEVDMTNDLLKIEMIVKMVLDDKINEVLDVYISVLDPTSRTYTKSEPYTENAAAKIRAVSGVNTDTAALVMCAASDEDSTKGHAATQYTPKGHAATQYTCHKVVDVINILGNRSVINPETGKEFPYDFVKKMNERYSKEIKAVREAKSSSKDRRRTSGLPSLSPSVFMEPEGVLDVPSPKIIPRRPVRNFFSKRASGPSRPTLTWNDIMDEEEIFGSPLEDIKRRSL